VRSTDNGNHLFNGVNHSTYQYVRLIPKVLRAVHLKLFTLLFYCDLVKSPSFH